MRKLVSLQRAYVNHNGMKIVAQCRATCAHVVGDARPQLTRRGDDDVARSITVERSTALREEERKSGAIGMGRRYYSCIRVGTYK